MINFPLKQELDLGFNTGINCIDLHMFLFFFQAILWRYKFSQLKGSSDDGKSKIKFLFQNPDTKQIEAKVNPSSSHKPPLTALILLRFKGEKI